MNSIQPQNPFDTMRQVTPEGGEFWSARDLMSALGYSKWQKFADAVDRARVSCEVTGHSAVNHFLPAPVKSTGGRPQEDFHLSRYACYLTAMNGDPRKPEIAAAQAYFVQQTRKAEIQATQTAAVALITAEKFGKVTGQSRNAVINYCKRYLKIPPVAVGYKKHSQATYLFELHALLESYKAAGWTFEDGCEFETYQGRTTTDTAAMQTMKRISGAGGRAKQSRLLPTTDSLSLARELVQVETRRAEILAALGGAA